MKLVTYDNAKVGYVDGEEIVDAQLSIKVAGEDDRDLATVMRDSVAELRALAASG